MTTVASFKVGDRVSFCVLRHTSRTISISVNEGEIVDLLKLAARVKVKSKHYWVPIEKLRQASEPNELTEALMKGSA